MFVRQARERNVARVAAMVFYRCLMEPGTRVLYIKKAGSKKTWEPKNGELVRRERDRMVFRNGSKIWCVSCEGKESMHRLSGMAAQLVLVEDGLLDSIEAEIEEEMHCRIKSLCRKIDGVEYSVFYDDGRPVFEAGETLFEKFGKGGR